MSNLPRRVCDVLVKVCVSCECLLYLKVSLVVFQVFPSVTAALYATCAHTFREPPPFIKILNVFKVTGILFPYGFTEVKHDTGRKEGDFSCYQSVKHLFV